MFAFERIPDAVRVALLHGGVGRPQLTRIAQAVLEQLGGAWPGDPREGVALATDCLLAAWEEQPLDLHLAAHLLALQEKFQCLPAAQAQFLRFCVRQPTPDGDAVEGLLRRSCPSDKAYKRRLENEVKAGAFPFFALERARDFALSENAAPWLRRLIDAAPKLPAPLRLALVADADFAVGDYADAAANSAALASRLPGATCDVRQAECLYRLGRADEAVALWRKAHAARPWQINTVLRLTDVLLGRDRTDTPFPPGKGVVLLYTWNKAGEMDATLESLAASELEAAGGAARIAVLDNGSTDETPAVYAKWAAHFGERMSVTTLPVNIGAPAARNWLLSLPEVRQADWAAFLDDDVAVPHFWLRQLWAGLCAHPGAGVCGGHAVDYEAPMRQQWTDMQLVTPDDVAWPGRSPLSAAFDFTNPHEQCFNFGQFDCIRPAVTVIGCCHLFGREGLAALAGGHRAFDVRFSPSQSDDVDLDMRSWLAGRPCLFQGHLHVRHKRNSGGGKRSRRSETSAVCNWHKLQGSYDAEEIRQLADANRAALLADLAERLSLLGEDLDLSRATPKPLAAARDAAERFRLSVVIPTCNRRDILAQCLAALEAQSLAPGLFEVLIVDDGSEDDTPAFLQTYAPAFAFRHFRQQERGGPARARNRGIREARGGIIVFLNDDAVLEPDGLATHLAGHDGVEGGRVSVLGEFSLPDAFARSLWGHVLNHSDLLFDYAGMRPGRLYGANQYYTCNVSTPRDVLFEVGLFDEAFTGTWWGAEDIDIGLRLARAAPPVPVLYLDGCAARHMHDLTVRDFERMFTVRGGGAVRMFAKDPDAWPHYHDIRAEDVAFWRALPASCRAALEVFREALTETESVFPPEGDKPARLMERDCPDVTPLGHGLWTLREKPLNAVLRAYTAQAREAIALARADGTDMAAAAPRLYPVCLLARWLYDTLGVCAVPDIERFMATRRPAR
jgi:glycosyltransferase involved in cell wall biosynthesis